jgi:hypothetical protein
LFSIVAAIAEMYRRNQMEPIEFEHVTIESLRESHRGEHKLREDKPEQEKSVLRSPESAADSCLSQQAVSWLLALPEAVRPTKLAASYPRVVNRLCQLWRRPVEMDRYFEDLMIDRRGGRQGFPLNVAQELASLSDYYRRDVFPVRQTIWYNDRPQ